MASREAIEVGRRSSRCNKAEQHKRMMRVTWAALAIVGLVSIASGQSSSSTPTVARLFSNLGSYHRQIWTTAPEAQRYFDQGLTLVYAFNHEEAMRSFRRAAELDPKAPMPL